MAKRTAVRDAILNACKAIAPGVSWGYALTGARKSNLVEGSVVCNSVNFDWISKKDVQHATAQYNIIIIELDGNVDIDTIADDIFTVFNNTNMSGLVYSVDVTRIAYGAIPGAAKSSVVKIELDVEYPVE